MLRSLLVGHSMGKHAGTVNGTPSAGYKVCSVFRVYSKSVNHLTSKNVFFDSVLLFRVYNGNYQNMSSLPCS